VKRAGAGALFGDTRMRSMASAMRPPLQKTVRALEPRRQADEAASLRLSWAAQELLTMCLNEDTQLLLLLLAIRNRIHRATELRRRPNERTSNDDDSNV